LRETGATDFANKKKQPTTKEMMKLVIFVVAAILASIHAELVRMEPSVNVFSSRFWLKERTVDEYASVRAVFALKHNRANMEELDHKLMDISNPNSQNYGKWMKVNFSFFCFPFLNFIVFSSFWFATLRLKNYKQNSHQLKNTIKRLPIMSGALVLLKLDILLIKIYFLSPCRLKLLIKC
jgi:hypothetical protein